MKKKLFFIIDSLSCAGAERSLISFLSTLDYTLYEVDLQLFRYGGEFEQFIPKQVNLLPPLAHTVFLEKKISQQLLSFNLKSIISRLKYSIALRLSKISYNADISRLYWIYISPIIPNCEKTYDVAIAYAQGTPTFYVAEKMKAKIKMAWVNASYHLSNINNIYQNNFYRNIDHIITVSDTVLEIFKENYPIYAHKMKVIWDIQNTTLIYNFANAKISTQMGKEIPCLLTIARLNKEHKGYDISLEACKILKERGINFKWYAIGRGPYKEEMEEYIAANNLQDTFILLGTTSNPYPYIKDCTLYVQTSRHEGYGLSIAEARILNRPVVTTEFDAVYNQMVPGKNGLVVKQDPVAVADAIERLLKDKELYNSIVAYQQQEKKGNQEEIEKFYQLVE